MAEPLARPSSGCPRLRTLTQACCFYWLWSLVYRQIRINLDLMPLHLLEYCEEDCTQQFVSAWIFSYSLEFCHYIAPLKAVEPIISQLDPDLYDFQSDYIFQWPLLKGPTLRMTFKLTLTHLRYMILEPMWQIWLSHLKAFSTRPLESNWQFSSFFEEQVYYL